MVQDFRGQGENGLPRRFAPRNDEGRTLSVVIRRENTADSLLLPRAAQKGKQKTSGENGSKSEFAGDFCFLFFSPPGRPGAVP